MGLGVLEPVTPYQGPVGVQGLGSEQPRNSSLQCPEDKAMQQLAATHQGLVRVHFSLASGSVDLFIFCHC